jgi:hypothetical protein
VKVLPVQYAAASGQPAVKDMWKKQMLCLEFVSRCMYVFDDILQDTVDIHSVAKRATPMRRMYYLVTALQHIAVAAVFGAWHGVDRSQTQVCLLAVMQ